MKKLMKKVIVMVTTVMMLVGLLPAAVMAEAGDAATPTPTPLPTTGTVTIVKNGDDEDTYLSGAQFEFYQLASITNANGKWTYTVTAPFNTAECLGTAAGENLNDLPSNEWEGKIDTLAAAATEGTGTKSAVTGDDGSTGATTLGLGVYLVKEVVTPAGYVASRPFIVSIPSTNNYDGTGAGDALVYDITAKPKNESQTIDKTVDDSSVEVGQKLTYTLETDIPNYSSVFTNPVFNVYDQMSEGLTFDPASVEVTVDGTKLTDDAIAEAYELVTTFGEGSKKTFEVQFKEAFIKSHLGKHVIITYNATVNENAVYVIENKAGITYNNKPGKSTGKETPENKVYTYTIDLTKTGDKNTTDMSGLDGAEFSITKNDGEEFKIVVNGGATAVEGSTVTLTTGTYNSKAGKLVIKGLEEGTYVLRETKAPEGYSKLTNPITIVITAKSNGELDEEKTTINGVSVKGKVATPGTVPVTVENHKGFSLPSTGGMGTYLFTVGGIVIMAAAALVLVAMRKRNRA